jgi:hypothetical protein
MSQKKNRFLRSVNQARRPVWDSTKGPQGAWTFTHDGNKALRDVIPTNATNKTAHKMQSWARPHLA